MLHFDMGLILSTFGLIFVAELPDKTAFATLVLATKSHPLAVFIGVALAFLVQTIVAICFGGVLGLLPQHWVHVGSGVLFIVFAVLTWLKKEEEEEAEAEEASRRDEPFTRTIFSAFMVIFVAEWGDLTQLATATLAAKYKHDLPSLFVGALLALWSVTAVAIAVGNRAKDLIKPAVLQKAAAIAFAGVGAYILYTG